MVLLLLCSTFSFTACDRDDLNTDQYGNEISVLSFGPCPVLRGGILSFKGSNLDQITEVDLPGADPITAINVVQAGTKSEINIEVPAEKCDTGIVVLKTAKGGEIRTLTPITYTETIRFDNMFVGTEGNLDGAVGQTLTINGDYLNNVHTVIFANGVEVPGLSSLRIHVIRYRSLFHHRHAQAVSSLAMALTPSILSLRSLSLCLR